MTELFNTTKTYKVDHSKFGGIIYPSDFNTISRGNNNGSFIASRIVSDNQFDEQCRKNRDEKERIKQYEK